MDKYLELVTTTDDWYSQLVAFLVTTGSVYLVEMGIFLIGLAFYHFCIFMPRVRRKIYKEPIKEASRSLMRISGLLPSIGQVEKTQIEEDEDRDDATQKEGESAEPLLAEVQKRRKKLQLGALQDASTPPSSLRDDNTTPSATTPSTFVPPRKSLPRISAKKTNVVERTQSSTPTKENPFSLEKPYIVRSLRLSSRSEKPTPDNPPNSDQYFT